MIRTVLCAAGLSVLLGVACTQSYDDFDFSGSTAPAGGTGGTTTTSPGGGGTGATGGGGSGATGGTSTGGAGGTSTGGSGGTGGGATAECGGQQCDVSGTGVCCLPQDTGDATCEPDGQCGGGFTVVHCDGPEDCPSQYCCGIFDNGEQAFTSLECSGACNTAGRIVICTSDADACPLLTSCKNSIFLPQPYKTCQI